MSKQKIKTFSLDFKSRKFAVMCLILLVSTAFFALKVVNEDVGLNLLAGTFGIYAASNAVAKAFEEPGGLSNWFSKKFIIALCLFALITLALFFFGLTPEKGADGIKGVFGVYAGTNVASKGAIRFEEKKFEKKAIDKE